ncbi:MAG: hypothetical protein K2I96_01720 [Lachnospiraceae bacterium]|nr:hypothetical protein [Lachnospiraceae bacterium]
MIFITGDTHGRFERVEAFRRCFQTSQDDILIILGQASISAGRNMTGRKSECWSLFQSQYLPYMATMNEGRVQSKATKKVFER